MKPYKSLSHLPIILLLDLDGVLITTPAWRANELAADGYAVFDTQAVACLNELLAVANCELWLSSSRRKGKSLETFQAIFEARGIVAPLTGLLPVYPSSFSRKEELQAFIPSLQGQDFLIIDDDKSLNGLAPAYKKRLVLTPYHQGFREEQLALAKAIVRGN